MTTTTPRAQQQEGKATSGDGPDRDKIARRRPVPPPSTAPKPPVYKRRFGRPLQLPRGDKEGATEPETLGDGGEETGERQRSRKRQEEEDDELDKEGGEVRRGEEEEEEEEKENEDDGGDERSSPKPGAATTQPIESSDTCRELREAVQKWKAVSGFLFAMVGEIVKGEKLGGISRTRDEKSDYATEDSVHAQHMANAVVRQSERLWMTLHEHLERFEDAGFVGQYDEQDGAFRVTELGDPAVLAFGQKETLV